MLKYIVRRPFLLESSDEIYHTYTAEKNRIMLLLFLMKLNYYLTINASRISLRLTFQKDKKLRRQQPLYRGILFFLFFSLDYRQHMAIAYASAIETKYQREQSISLLPFTLTNAINMVHATLKEWTLNSRSFNVIKPLLTSTSFYLCPLASGWNFKRRIRRWNKLRSIKNDCSHFVRVLLVE